MGIEGVPTQGLNTPAPAPAQKPPSRSGPDFARETTQGARAQTKPEESRPAPPDGPSANDVLAKSGPQRAGTRLSVDANTKRIVAKIVDETNQVMKQIPPEDLLRVVANTREMQARLFDEMI